MPSAESLPTPPLVLPSGASLVVIGARGTEALIEAELIQLGATDVNPGRAQVSCRAVG